jgi:DNA modification methylase
VKAGRSARVIELDPKYVDVIIERWQAFSAGRAVLDGGGSYEEIAAGREAALVEDGPGE